MSRRPNAPYPDVIQEGGRVLIYEGHDIRKVAGGPDPKTVDQPLAHPDGRPTDNGKFFLAVEAAKKGEPPVRVHVYEKIVTDVWIFNGAFSLDDAWVEHSGGRQVCKFRLRMLDNLEDDPDLEHHRVIPSAVKAEVWKRDGGACVECGAQENLHFDHIIPFSKGGTSLLASNIQIMCARHNLRKSSRIA